jgi:uncharacterized membrane protein YkgB
MPFGPTRLLSKGLSRCSLPRLPYQHLAIRKSLIIFSKKSWDERSKEMNILLRALGKTGLLKGDLDYHLIRASMVIIYFFFGYQKWFDYEAQGLIPFFTHGPLIFWMYSAFGIRGATYLLGVSEWLFGALLLAGFWNKKLGVLGALGSVVTFICTVTIIPFMPDGWAPSAGGFPAMVGNVAFLMKDVVLLAASLYLLKQDALRIASAASINELKAAHATLS